MSSDTDAPLPDLPPEVVQMIFDAWWADFQPLIVRGDGPIGINLSTTFQSKELAGLTCTASWLRRRATTGELIGRAVRALAAAAAVFAKLVSLIPMDTENMARVARGESAFVSNVDDPVHQGLEFTGVFHHFLPRIRKFTIGGNGIFTYLPDFATEREGSGLGHCRDQPCIAFVVEGNEAARLAFEATVGASPEWRDRVYVVPLQKKKKQAWVLDIVRNYPIMQLNPRDYLLGRAVHNALPGEDFEIAIDSNRDAIPNYEPAYVRVGGAPLQLTHTGTERLNVGDRIEVNVPEPDRTRAVRGNLGLTYTRVDPVTMERDATPLGTVTYPIRAVLNQHPPPAPPAPEPKKQ